MKFDFLNLLIVFVIILILIEFKGYKDNIMYILIPLTVIYSVLNHYNFINSLMFNLECWKLVFLFLIFVLYLVVVDLMEEKSFDIYCLITLVFLGSVVLILCDNLITLYLGLELQTFSTFILIAKNRTSIKSSEAGLKYFILGALSSGFYLLGLITLFLGGYSLEIREISLLSFEFINIVSLTFISLSFCFKLSMFPLHFWIPDIYEGSSWDIISLISTLPKISMLSVLIQLMINSNLLLIFSLLSIVIGTLGALNQTKIKRLLGYSGIAHMGFIVLGFSLLNRQGFTISNLYLIVYMAAMISIFIVIINSNISNKFIIELGGLKFLNKVLALSFLLLVLSIAGIPPLSGFISKWFLLLTTVENFYNVASFIIILFSAIGAGYYLRVIKIIYFQNKSSYFLWRNILLKEDKKNNLLLLILGFLIYISLFLILNFSFLIDFININTIGIF
nr:NADH dehydrogenase subunit 2 [Aequorea sp. MKL-2023]